MSLKPKVDILSQSSPSLIEVDKPELLRRILLQSEWNSLQKLEKNNLLHQILMSIYVLSKSDPLEAASMLSRMEWKNMFSSTEFQGRIGAMLLKIVINLNAVDKRSFPLNSTSTFLQVWNGRWSPDLLQHLLKAEYIEFHSYDQVLEWIHFADSLGIDVNHPSWFTYLIICCKPKIDLRKFSKHQKSFTRKIFDIDFYFTTNGKFSHDLESYSALIQVLAASKQISRCLFYLNRMLSEKIIPDARLFNSIIENCDTLKHRHLAMPIYKFMTKKLKVVPNHSTYDALLKCASKYADFNFSKILLQQRCRSYGSTISSFNMVVRGAVASCQIEPCLNLIKSAQKQFKLQVNEVTFLPLLTLYSSRNTFSSEKIVDIVRLMKKMQVRMTWKSQVKIIRSYLLDGHIDKAKKELENTLDYYRQQNLPVPNSLSVAFMEVMMAYSQIPTRRANINYFYFYNMAKLYYGDSILHQYWLKRLSVKPEKRLGDRRDNMSIPAVFYEPDDYIE